VQCLREAGQLLESLQRLSIAAGTEGPTDIWLGEGYLALGRLEEAEHSSERLLQAAHIRYARPVGLYLLGRIETERDRFDAEKGEEHYRRALALLEELGMRLLIAHCHLGLAKLFRRTGQREQAHEHLTIATTMYREMDMRFWLEQAEAELKELA
jgi:tetratricopeptide (TPR) repeat protein